MERERFYKAELYSTPTSVPDDEQRDSSSENAHGWSRPTIRRFGLEQTLLTPLSGPGGVNY